MNVVDSLPIWTENHQEGWSWISRQSAALQKKIFCLEVFTFNFFIFTVSFRSFFRRFSSAMASSFFRIVLGLWVGSERLLSFNSLCKWSHLVLLTSWTSTTSWSSSSSDSMLKTGNGKPSIYTVENQSSLILSIKRWICFLVGSIRECWPWKHKNLSRKSKTAGTRIIADKGYLLSVKTEGSVNQLRSFLP